MIVLTILITSLFVLSTISVVVLSIRAKESRAPSPRDGRLHSSILCNGRGVHACICERCSEQFLKMKYEREGRE